MTATARRVASLMLALLLVTTAGAPVGPSPVGTAQAAEAGECSALDDFVMFLSLGTVNTDSCSRQAYVDDVVADMQASDANQTEVDIFSAALSAKAGSDTFLAPMENYVADTDSVAWMKAEKAVAEAYANGSTMQEAKQAGRNAISEYYAQKQLNVVKQGNQKLSELYYLSQSAQSETGISGSFIQGYYREMSEWRGLQRTLNKSVSLVNGTSTKVFGIETWKTAGYGFIGSVEWNDGQSRPEIYVQPPNSDYNRTLVHNASRYKSLMSEIATKHDALRSEVGTYVDATWDDYDAGRINASDVISSHTAMFEYGTRTANESEGLYNSVAALSMMGYDTPNLTNTGTMTVEYRGANYTGIVLADEAPGGSWSTGETYDPGNMTGPVFMATTNGTKVDLTAEFTVTGMTSRSGEQVGQVETTQYAYKTANTSQVLALQKQLVGLRAEIESREPTGAGGSGGSGSGLNPMLLAGLAAAAVGALALREN